MQLKDVRAVITGGASGLGHSVATYLYQHGAQVVLFDINEEDGVEAAKTLGERAQFMKLDVTNEAEAQEKIKEAQTAMGGLNTVVNCAGILGAGRVLGREAVMPLDNFARTVMVNLVGSFNIAKTAAALMAENDADEDGGRGVIINTASVAAYEGQIGQAAYSASKGGVVGMTLPMAREFARVGIRVMTLAPGVFHTPMVDGMPEHVYQSLCEAVPFPSRLGKPQEFAEAVAFIVQNNYMNGSVIRLDGAIRLAPK